MPQKRKFKVGTVVMLLSHPKWLKAAGLVCEGLIGEVKTCHHTNVEVVCEFDSNEQPETYDFWPKDLIYLDYDPAMAEVIVGPVTTEMASKACCRCGEDAAILGKDGMCKACYDMAYTIGVAALETNDVLRQLELI